MSYYTIKLRLVDKLFSNHIRAKANWTCEKCGRKCKINGETVYRLEASHYHSRRKESVRFDYENVYALCFTCHKRMGGHTKDENGEYDLWLKEKLGMSRYKMLNVRAETYKKKDDKMIMLILKQLKKYD